MNYERRPIQPQYEYHLTLTKNEVQVIQILATSTELSGWEEDDDKTFIRLLRRLAL